MNFVVIMSDTLRADYLEPYGNTWVKTPAAARFAEQSAVFENAYCASFPTIPCRTDLFTGRFGYPFHPWLPLAYDEVTLPRILGEAGYVTQIIFDTPHLMQGGHNFDHPFNGWEFIRGQEVDRFGMDHAPVEFPVRDTSKINIPMHNRLFAQYMRNVRGRKVEEDWATHKTFQTAVNWLERNYKHEKFFLWIDGFDPHEPPWPPQQYVEMYDPGYDGDLLLSHLVQDRVTARDIQHTKARYAGTVTFVDRCVGRVLQAVDDLGLSENTCVIWMSDHGTHLGEHGKLLGKTCRYKEIAQIAFMARLPGGGAAGKRIVQIMQPPDLAPTILELAGLPALDRAQGVSLAPLLRGEKMETRPLAVSGWYPAAGWTQNCSIRITDGRWAFVDFVEPGKRELFDLRADPGETRNVIGEHPEEAARFHEAALDYLSSHDAQEALLRAYEAGDLSPLGEMRPPRPGYESFMQYFLSSLWNSRTLPEV